MSAGLWVVRDPVLTLGALSAPSVMSRASFRPIHVDTLGWPVPHCQAWERAGLGGRIHAGGT